MTVLIAAEPAFSRNAAQVDASYRTLVKSGRWLDHPMIVTIETYAKCNAACTFCPYVELDRIGDKLSKEQVQILIDEVATFEVPPARLNLSRVNEPFLDPDMLDYLQYADDRLPKTDLMIFSNGQTITDKVADHLSSLPRFKRLAISFNEHDEETYQTVMGIRQKQTLKRIRRLHDRLENDELDFSVTLSRVGTSDAEDAAFAAWCAKEFPLMPIYIGAKFDWLNQDQNLGLETTPDAGCVQWFSLHVLADSKSAFCCIDGAGDSTLIEVGKTSLLDIYNEPTKRALRERPASRRTVPGCKTCIHAMAADSYEAVDTLSPCQIRPDKDLVTLSPS